MNGSAGSIGIQGRRVNAAWMVSGTGQAGAPSLIVRADTAVLSGGDDNPQPNGSGMSPCRTPKTPTSAVSFPDRAVRVRHLPLLRMPPVRVSGANPAEAGSRSIDRLPCIVRDSARRVPPVLRGQVCAAPVTRAPAADRPTSGQPPRQAANGGRVLPHWPGMRHEIACVPQPPPAVSSS